MRGFRDQAKHRSQTGRGQLRDKLARKLEEQADEVVAAYLAGIGSDDPIRAYRAVRNSPFHQLAQKNRGIVCTMNLSLLKGLLAGLDTNEFSPSLEIEPDRCCVVLRPTTQRKPSESQLARSARSRSEGTS